MTLLYEDEYGKEFPFPVEALAKEVMVHCLDYEQCPYETEVSLLLTTNEKIRIINKEYRKIDSITDVLSFPTAEFKTAGDFSEIEKSSMDCFNPETGELILGDIVISGEKVWEQAKSFEHSLKREFAFLFTHSMLHLMGYDHIEMKEEKNMVSKQAEILKQLGITR